MLPGLMDRATSSAGISDFNSISAQNHTPAVLSRQPPIALVSFGGSADRSGLLPGSTLALLPTG